MLTVTVSDGTVADGGAMWVVGDWGQDSPWSRDTGVQMVKGADDVYTGELSLPKGHQVRHQDSEVHGFHDERR